MQRDKVGAGGSDRGRRSLLGKGRSPRVGNVRETAACAARTATLVEIHSRLSSFYLASFSLLSLPLVSRPFPLSSARISTKKLEVRARALALSGLL